MELSIWFAAICDEDKQPVSPDRVRQVFPDAEQEDEFCWNVPLNLPDSTVGLTLMVEDDNGIFLVEVEAP